MSTLKYIIHEKPNFRSSRVHNPTIAYPVMTSHRVKVYQNDPSIVEDATPEEDDPLWHYYEVNASDYMPAYFPYFAFCHDDESNGWLCPIVEGEDQWISIRLDNNWRQPYRNLPFKISKIEIVNADVKEHICKQFMFQARNGLAPWHTLKTCSLESEVPEELLQKNGMLRTEQLPVVPSVIETVA